MRLGHIQKRELVTEGWNDPAWTLFEQKEIHPWVTRIEQYVFEANLSQDQIKNLFTGIEQGATAAGGNRTIAGKAVDVAKLPVEAVKWIDTQINKLGGLIQNAGPVKNADAKFEELKKKIGEKDSKVVSAVKAVSDWAKKNPGKASVAVGILTAAAAVAGGPLGGAIAGFLARATKDLLQGEKLSTAVGKSIKTAAYGAIAGWALNGIGDWLEGLRVDAIPYDKAPGLTTLKVGFTDTFEMPGFKQVRDLGSMIIPEDRVGEFTELLNTMKDATAASGSTDSATALDAFNKLWNFAKTFDTAEFIADMNLSNEISKAIAVSNDQFLSNLEMANSAIAAAAQASIQTSGGKKAEFKVGGEKVSPEAQPQMAGRVYTGQKLSEGQIYLLFNRLSTVNGHMLENKLMFESVFDALSHYNRKTINEGPLDALKKGAKAVGGAIKGAAKQVTTKVTAEKLMTAWKKAGSPTDSDEIYDVIKGLGVADDVIKGTYDSMQITPPAKTDAPDADKDAGAADADTSADAPTDSTAGDAGSDTTTTGAASADAGGDDPAPTDNAKATSNDDLGKAKQAAAMKKGRGLSPEEEKQVEKDFTATKELEKQGIKQGTEIQFTSRAGKKEQGTIVGPSMDGDETKVTVKDTKNKTFNVSKEKLTDKSGNPIAKPKAGSPDASPEDNLARTGNPVGAPTDGATDANTASTSGDDTSSATSEPSSPAPTNRGAGQGQNTAAPGGKTSAQVDVNKLAAEIKKLNPEQIEDAKKLLAA